MRKRNVGSAAAAIAVIAVAALSIYAVAGVRRGPAGAIGQADAATNIQVVGTFDVLQIILAAGIAAALVAILLTIRSISKNRR